MQKAADVLNRAADALKPFATFDFPESWIHRHNPDMIIFEMPERGSISLRDMLRAKEVHQELVSLHGDLIHGGNQNGG